MLTQAEKRKIRLSARAAGLSQEDADKIIDGGEGYLDVLEKLVDLVETRATENANQRGNAANGVDGDGNDGGVPGHVPRACGL